MRFLKTVDGVYLNVTQIGSLYLDTHGVQRVVILANTIFLNAYKESKILVCDYFPDKDAAKRYLRRIVAALTDTEKKIIEVKNYEAD